MKILILFISVLLIFASGLLFIEHLIVSIFLLILGFAIQAYDYIQTNKKINKKIDGIGVESITVGKEPPKNPKKGDLWVDTN